MTRRIGIDVTVANTPPLSGVGNHILRLLQALDTEADADLEFLLFYPARDREARRRARQVLPTSPRMRLVEVPFLRRLGAAHELHRRLVLPWSIRRHRCDIFHGPAHVLPHVTNRPTVLTIHDLAFFDFDLYNDKFSRVLREAVLRSMAAAAAIIAVSDFTRRQVHRVSTFSVPVHVIHNGGTAVREEPTGTEPGDDERLQAIGLRGPFVLYVGDFNPRKNLSYMVESFAALARSNGAAKLQLALVGNAGAEERLLRAHAASFGLATHDIVMPGRVPDDLLPVLFRHASAFALTSLMEGSSIVALEAMSHGVPVVATDVGPMREIGGDAMELIPLDAPATAAEALARATTKGPRRDEMRRLGLARANQFTWQAAAKQTLEVYASLLARRPARTGRSTE